MIRSNTTIVHLVFHSWKHGAIALDGGSSAETSPEVAGLGTTTSLVSYAWDKDLSAPSGQLMLTMKGYAQGCTFTPAGEANQPARNGDPWLDLLENGDWWQMSIERNGQVLGVSFGIVDEIGLSMIANQGETQIGVSVTGRGTTFALEDVPVYFNPHDPAANNALGVFMLQIINSVAGPAEEVVVGIIQGMFGVTTGRGLFGSQIRIPPSMEYLIPGGPASSKIPRTAEHWIDLLGYRLVQDLEGSVAIPQVTMETQESEQSVWAFANMWRNPPMNELFLDIDPTGGQPTADLILREKPFVNATDGNDSPWFYLPTAIVDTRALTEANLTKGQHRVNHVLLLGDLTGALGQEAFALHPPAANFSDIHTYGLKRLLEDSNYYEDVGAGAAETRLKHWRARIIAWNALNHRYLCGTMQIGEARADIRVGQKLALVSGPIGRYSAFPASAALPNGEVPEDALTFYVEGVRYSGEFGPEPRHRTDVRVSRGFVESDRVPTVTAAVQAFAEQTTTAVGSEGSPNNTDLAPNESIVPIEGVTHEAEVES